MKNKLLILWIKIQLSAKASFKVFKNWKYLGLAALISLLFIQLLYWLLNPSLLRFFITTPSLTILEKFKIFAEVIGSYLASIPLWQAIVVVSLSIVQGLVISLLIFTIRNQTKLDKKSTIGSTIATVVAMFSVGCVSCGTSIIAPVIGIFVAGASASLSEAINKVAVVFGLLIALYALYAVGLSVANTQAKTKPKP